ncbi:MAG: F0F1 ATP synthase subunit gamma [Alphaproteobacteria bacterium]|nr:F0F1 ATP synthase subunit gamma [Alphaproteobacteria bacterium]
MPSLKDLKNRIVSVKSTRKITSAMKMVAASKLRRAQEQAEAARPYAQAMARMLQSLSANLVLDSNSSPLIAGTGKQDTVLLLVITSDRGLCGGFNGTVVREARKQIKSLQQEGKQVRLFCVGRKGRDLLKREYAALMLASLDDVGKKKLDYADAEKIVAQLLALLAEGKFDVCRMVYNRFKSVISQIVTTAQIVPVAPPPANENAKNEGAQALMLFEPDEEAILNQLLPQNLAVQVYGALLESLAGEMGARMTAMDNATRNAGDMINRLTLQYNRSRQAYITKELIEIISGAEAV